MFTSTLRVDQNVLQPPSNHTHIPRARPGSDGQFLLPSQYCSWLLWRWNWWRHQTLCQLFSYSSWLLTAFCSLCFSISICCWSHSCWYADLQLTLLPVATLPMMRLEQTIYAASFWPLSQWCDLNKQPMLFPFGHSPKDETWTNTLCSFLLATLLMMRLEQTIYAAYFWALSQWCDLNKQSMLLPFGHSPNDETWTTNLCSFLCPLSHGGDLNKTVYAASSGNSLHSLLRLITTLHIIASSDAWGGVNKWPGIHST